MCSRLWRIYYKSKLIRSQWNQNKNNNRQELQLKQFVLNRRRKSVELPAISPRLRSIAINYTYQFWIIFFFTISIQDKFSEVSSMFKEIIKIFWPLHENRPKLIHWCFICVIYNGMLCLAAIAREHGTRQPNRPLLTFYGGPNERGVTLQRIFMAYWWPDKNRHWTLQVNNI